MKKIIGLCLAIISFSNMYSQVTLNFCASVEQNGYCNFNNTRFIASPDSTRQKILMEVKSTAKTSIGATNLMFKIYKVDSTGAEKFVTIIQQNIKPDWFYAWTPYFFNSPNRYDVKVYNENDQLICSQMFELIAFK